MVTVDILYATCDKIDNGLKDKTQDMSKEFGVILSGVKSSTNEKRLAGQLIIRYFVQFPALQDQSIDALFELCEDEDILIRKSVVKDLASLCKSAGPHVQKIADVLVQLLQADDAQENAIVQNSLFQVFTLYTNDTLRTIFRHILSAEEELLRERAIKFLSDKLLRLPSALVTKELEEYVIDEMKKVMQDVTGEEFMLIMNLLSQLSSLKTVAGRSMLIEIVTDQADLDKPFDPADPDRVDQINQCIRQAIPSFSRNVSSKAFFTFLVDNVIPHLAAVGESSGEEGRCDLLRSTAELSITAGDLENIGGMMQKIFDQLMQLLPLPPSEDAQEESRDPEEPNLAFTDLECMLFTLHRLGRKNNDFLVSTERADPVKEFRKRLQYLARLIQVYSKKLNTVLKDKSKEELLSEENRIKLVAAKTTRNLSTLIKDLLHVPPSYRAEITLSWKATVKNPEENRKRLSSSNADDLANKVAKPERGIYVPPTGKYSEKVGQYQGGGEEVGNGYRGGGGWRRGRGYQANRGGGGFRRGGGGRFRGRGRAWY